MSFTYKGFKVIESVAVLEKTPKFSLGKGDFVSDEVRKEFDRWLIEMFGYAPQILLSKIGGQWFIFVHPNNKHYLERVNFKKVRDLISGKPDGCLQKS